MRIYDVSVPISAGTPTYPGDPGVEIKEWLSLAKGDPANVSVLQFGAHAGTHIDAPAHFIEGAAQVNSLGLDRLIGEAQVVEVPDDMLVVNEEVVATHVKPGTSRVLFKTRNSNFWNDPSGKFQADYTYLDADAARGLVQRGVRVVGIDYLSVERFHSADFETHHVLLKNGIVIIEGLDLREVRPGIYELICLPLRISGGSGDGAPARAILRTLNSEL